MKTLTVVLLFCLVLFASCSNPLERSVDGKICFWEYSHVFLTIKRDESDESYSRTTEPISSAQIDTLKKILVSRSINFFQNQDSAIWISEIDIRSLGQMYDLDCELFRRMKVDRKSWKYDDE